MFVSEAEQNFWRRLCSPFPANAYSLRDGQGGKKFTYLKKRVLENRLDEVVGPANWDTEYETGPRGVTCRLKLRYIEYNTATEQAVVFKEPVRCAGGAFRDDQGMTADGAEKSGYTSAFRAACAAFGIGRELYGEGMPSYVADLFGSFASGLPQSRQTMPTPQPQQSYQPSGGGNYQSGQGNGEQPRFDPPIGKTGKSTYAWAKKVGEYFAFDILGMMITLAGQRGLPKFTDQWDQQFTNEALANAMAQISRLPNYKGELDQWMPQQPNTQAQQSAPAQQPQQQQSPYHSGQNYADAVANNIANAPQQQPAADPLLAQKKAITAQVTALIFSQTGRQPSTEEIVAGIGEIGASVPDGAGIRGQVLRLRTCNDKVWLHNVKAAADNRIAALAREKALLNTQEDDGLPC